MNTTRNISPQNKPSPGATSRAAGIGGTDRYGLRPLSARSLILSILLGGPPLPPRALVAVGELFDISGGTIRTALSRMTAADELITDDGRFAPGPRQTDRQVTQTSGRVVTENQWSGEWWSVVVDAESRSIADRRSFRSLMVAHRLGELRPDLWLRPANIDPPPVSKEWFLLSGPVQGREPRALVWRLWPIDDLRQRAEFLLGELERSAPSLADDDGGVIPVAFLLSAAVVRFLRTEPQLPAELLPEHWPGNPLRRAYDDYEQAFQARLRWFLRQAG